MKKTLLILISFIITVFAHPVSYKINLSVSYDTKTNKAKIGCTSNSKNKCGLYSVKLLNKKGNELANKKFPFLKKSITLKSDIKPTKLEFYLRKTPEHKYIKIF